jgi:cytochrome c peroxidase
VAVDRAVAPVVFVALLSACGSDDQPAPGGGTPPPTGVDKTALMALRYDSGPPPADPSNRYSDDPAARVFGRRLFFDASFSGPLLEGDNDGTGGTLGKQGEAGKVSCAGCHLPQSGFVDTRSPHRQISLAAEWTIRRTPTLLDIAFAPLYNWDGRRDSLWNQAIGVMESSKEFNSSRLFVAQRMFAAHRVEYEALFGAMPPLDDALRFPLLTPAETGCVEVRTMQGSTYDCRGKPGDGADYDAMTPADQEAVTRVTVNTAKAIAAYVGQLRCGPSRFDQWLDGDETALDPSEQRGAALFAGKAACVGCHSGPNLTDQKFHNVGLAPSTVAVAFVDENDRGAAEGIQAALADPLSSHGPFSDGDRKALPDAVGPELEGAFRTPSLRCTSKHPSFMHTGQIRSLEQAVNFHNRGGDPPGHYPGVNELEPLGLSESERADLVAFIKALEGTGPDSELLEPP